MSRWVRFFIAILCGIGLGLLYGWVISPVEYVNTTPNTLRMDYKTDFVLMVAEAYSNDHNLSLAVRRLALLAADPADATYQAIIFAQKAGYTDADLALMRILLDDLQTHLISPETPPP